MTYPGPDSPPEQPTLPPSGIPTQPTYQGPPFQGSAFQGQQYPAPPTYDPAVMAQQFSGPPISGPYGYGPPVPPPAPRGRAATVILSVLATLLLLATGVVTTLFVLKSQDADALKRQSSEQSSTISTQQGKLDSVQKDLDAARRDAADARSQLDEMTQQKNIVAGCVSAIDDYGTEVGRSGRDSAASKVKLTALDKACTEAEKYL